MINLHFLKPQQLQTSPCLENSGKTGSAADTGSTARVS